MKLINIKAWSIRKKLLIFGCSLLAGGMTILSLTIGALTLFQRFQGEIRSTIEVQYYLSQVENDYHNISMALANFVASGKEEFRTKKTEASRTLDDHLKTLKGLRISENVGAVFEQISSFNEKEISPFEQRLLTFRKTHTTEETLNFYEKQFIPLADTMQSALEGADMAARSDFEDINARAQKYIRLGAGIIGLAIFLGTLVGFILSAWMANWLGRTLGAAIDRLEQESRKTREATAEVNQAAQNLAQSTTEQAAALQETAASIEEMSAMIAKSAENATQSGENASASVEVASQGKKSAEEMVGAIHAINESNADIMHAIEESNRKITEITKVIAEIGNKTKVINDIVFQTKLLSFNASVEAARAGEHGKGFAVVAEEVGNLAQMSGNAAKEIAQMLDSSIRKVEGIVTETRTAVQSLIAAGKTKVAAGTKIAEESGQVLDRILEQANAVNTNIGEIATATREQSQGVSEITKAMGQLDTVTQQNSTTSNQIASNAGRLATQTNNLRVVVHQLEDVVWGIGVKNGGPGSPSGAAPSINACPDAPILEST